MHMKTLYRESIIVHSEMFLNNAPFEYYTCTLRKIQRVKMKVRNSQIVITGLCTMEINLLHIMPYYHTTSPTHCYLPHYRSPAAPCIFMVLWVTATSHPRMRPVVARKQAVVARKQPARRAARRTPPPDQYIIHSSGHNRIYSQQHHRTKSRPNDSLLYNKRHTQPSLIYSSYIILPTCDFD